MEPTRSAVFRSAGITLLLVAALVVLVVLLDRRTAPVRMVEPPGRDRVVRIDGDTAILVNGRRVSPVGRVIRTQSYNWGMAVTRDLRVVALVNPSAIQIVDLDAATEPVRVPPFGEKAGKELGSGSYMGCALSPDGRILYFGSADTGEVKVFDLAARRVVGSVSIDGNGYRDSLVGAFVLDHDGSRLYALDQFNYRLVVVDLTARAVLQSIPVGRSPFALALSPDQRHAWVSNVGMFEYPLLPGVTPDNRRRGRPLVPRLRVSVEAGRRGDDGRGTRCPGPRLPEPSRRDVGLQGEPGDGSGGTEGQDRIPGGRAPRRNQDCRRGQPGSRRGGPRQCVRSQRNKRQRVGRGRLQRDGRGSDRAHRAGARDLARRAAVRRRAGAGPVASVRRLRRSECGRGRRHARAARRGIHPGGLVRRARRALTRREPPGRLERQGTGLGSEWRHSLPRAGPRSAPGRHHARHAAGAGRADGLGARAAHRRGRRQHRPDRSACATTRRTPSRRRQGYARAPSVT